MMRMMGNTVAAAVGLLILAGSPAVSAPPNVTYPTVSVSVNQEELDTPGILVRGNSLVPVRQLVERLNGKVMFHSPSKTLWATFPEEGQTIRMKIGDRAAEVYAYDANDPHRTGDHMTTLQLDQAPMLLGGHVLAPVGAIADVAEAKVFFKPETKHVFVESQPGGETASR